MKLSLIIIGLFLMAPLSSGAADAAVADKAKATVQVIKVPSMVCSLCAQGIEKKFSEMKEVEKIDVDLDTKNVTLTFKPGQSLSQKTMHDVIYSSGYEKMEFL